MLSTLKVWTRVFLLHKFVKKSKQVIVIDFKVFKQFYNKLFNQF